MLKVVLFVGPRNFFLLFEPLLLFWAAVNASLANVVVPRVQIILVGLCVIS